MGFDCYSSKVTLVESCKQCITAFYQHFWTVFTASFCVENLNSKYETP